MLWKVTRFEMGTILLMFKACRISLSLTMQKYFIWKTRDITLLLLLAVKEAHHNSIISLHRLTLRPLADDHKTGLLPQVMLQVSAHDTSAECDRAPKLQRQGLATSTSTWPPPEEEHSTVTGHAAMPNKAVRYWVKDQVCQQGLS